MCDQSLSESQLTEHIHHSFHGRLICNSDGSHVQNFVQPQDRRGSGERLWLSVILDEPYDGVASQTFQSSLGVSWKKKLFCKGVSTLPT
jgi:hypothetical protein